MNVKTSDLFLLSAASSVVGFNDAILDTSNTPALNLVLVSSGLTATLSVQGSNDGINWVSSTVYFVGSTLISPTLEFTASTTTTFRRINTPFTYTRFFLSAFTAGTLSTQALPSETETTPLPLIDGSIGVYGGLTGTPLFGQNTYAPSAAGDQTLVTGTANQSIWVKQFAFSTASTVNWFLKSNATRISSTFAHGNTSTSILQYSPHGWFRCAAGEDLVLNTSLAVTCGVTYVYFKF